MVLRSRFPGGVAAAAFALVSCAAPRAASRPEIPPLALVDTAGATRRFPEDLRRSAFTVVVFFSEHCPCFESHEGRLRALARAYESRGVAFVYVDSEVSATPARDAHAAAERGLTPIALDPGARLADALGADYAAFAVVLDRDGRARYRGGIDSDKNTLSDDARFFLRDALEELLAGREPRVAEGKALGCALQKH